MSHRIGYAVLLDDASHNYARRMELDISKRFQTRGGLRQSPHITIKPPFTVEVLEPFIEYFDQFAQETKPFEIKLSGIDFSNRRSSSSMSKRTTIFTIFIKKSSLI